MFHIAQSAVTGPGLPQHQLLDLMSKQQTHPGVAQLVDRRADDGGGQDRPVALVPKQLHKQMLADPRNDAADHDGRHRVERDRDVVKDEFHNRTSQIKQQNTSIVYDFREKVHFYFP